MDRVARRTESVVGEKREREIFRFQTNDFALSTAAFTVLRRREITDSRESERESFCERDRKRDTTCPVRI